MLKGLEDAKKRGVLAGYAVVDFKVIFYGGSYHEVDSSDIAFNIAASRAFKLAMREAKPTLLEPTLTSITGGRGSFLMEFSHYEEVPSHLQQKIIAEAVKEGRVKPEEE